MVLHKGMVGTDKNWVNRKANEVVAHRLMALKRAFGKVKGRDDWQEPKGGNKAWKSKVEKHYLGEMDLRAILGSGEGGFDDAEAEMEDRMRRRHLSERMAESYTNWSPGGPVKPD